MPTFLISREERWGIPARLRSSYVLSNVFVEAIRLLLSHHKMEMEWKTGPAVRVILILFAAVTFTESSPGQLNTVRTKAGANNELAG